MKFQLNHEFKLLRYNNFNHRRKTKNEETGVERTENRMRLKKKNKDILIFDDVSFWNILRFTRTWCTNIWNFNVIFVT